MLTECETHEIGFIPFRPLRAWHDAAQRQSLMPAASRLGASTDQIDLAWLLAVSPVTLPIPEPQHARTSKTTLQPVRSTSIKTSYTRSPQPCWRCISRSRLGAGVLARQRPSHTPDGLDMTTALISGASRGLGFEVARQLVAAGHQVWIGARDEARGRHARLQIHSARRDPQCINGRGSRSKSAAISAAWLSTSECPGNRRPSAATTWHWRATDESPSCTRW